MLGDSLSYLRQTNGQQYGYKQSIILSSAFFYIYSLGRLSRINEIPLCILTCHFTVADKALQIQTSTETSYYNVLDLNSSLQSTKNCLIHFTISYEVAFQSREPLFTKLESQRQLSLPHKYSQNAQGGGYCSLRSMNTPQVVFVQLYTFYQSHSSPTSRQSLSCPDPPDQSPLYHTIPSSPQYFPALNFSFEYTETLFSSPSLQSLAQLPQKYPFSSLSFSCEPNNKPSPES